ncbi:sensor histidine kinase [Paenibacillus thailandensis]|uniref:Sensor histidine kinase n=1 Tax=Paenibacillus thailandensis TaxID=393250 RepID=A0ABW5QYS1_9BACL
MNWGSIRTKLIVFLLLATIIPIVTTMVVTYSYSVKSLKERAVEENESLLFQGQTNIGSLLDDMNASSLNVYSDPEFYRMLSTDSLDLVSNSAIYSALYYISSSIPDAHQVYLYASKSKLATIVTKISNTKRMLNADPFSEPVEQTVSSAVTVQPTHLSHTYGFESLQPEQKSEQVITLHRRITAVPLDKTLGYLSIDMKLDPLIDILRQLYDQSKENIYVIDGKGTVVYADDSGLMGEKIRAGWYDSRSGQLTDSGYFEQDDSLFVYSRLNSELVDWTIVKQIPTSYLAKGANEAAMINILLLAVSLIVIIALTVAITVRMTKPIKQLVRYMSEVQAGNLNVDVIPSSKGEIGLVIEQFGRMMRTINHLIVNEYKLELASKTNQLKALQAQINPHFLNNTLQIIGTLALELNVPRIYALLSSLAKMMRYSMDNAATATMREELAHLNAYIELQKERFENRFEFRYDVEDALMELSVPRMILQPVVENYFKHGLDRAEQTGLLSLTAVMRESEIRITVENNGTSIPEERIRMLHYALKLNDKAPNRAQRLFGGDAFGGAPETEPASDDSTSSMKQKLKKAQDGADSRIGLLNVLERMQMVYGPDASLSIENVKPKGVRIEMRMNLQNKMERDEG